jgi:recombination protein RecR
MKYPNSLNNLIENLKLLPGIGEKTAERLAFAIKDFDKNRLDDFANAIIDVKNKIKQCSICHNITEKDICEICSDKNRNQEVLCVVEDAKNVILFEKHGFFDGKYHVLEGLISPINGINPEDINIASLLNRIKKEKIKEVIIAIKPTLEGEATTQYISKMLDGLDIKVTKIAHGIPMGIDMDYLDPLTLEIALYDRTEV